MTSKKNTLNSEDVKKWTLNVLMFSAPIMATFFGLLAEGVSIEKAWPVAVLSLYGAIADLFRKFKAGK